MSIQKFKTPEFQFINGDTLSVEVAYKIIEPTAKASGKWALVPTCYGGRIDETYAFPQALASHKIVVVAMLGNGESSSPSNHTSFPATLDYRDVVRSQHALCQHLGIERLDAVIGFSMGGQQAFYWPALYPDYVATAVPICGSARTSGHNWTFLEGPIAALTVSADYHDGDYRAHGVRTPTRGKRAFSRVYKAWLTSAAWYRQELWRKEGHASLAAAIDAGQDGWEDWEAEDMLILARMWQAGDIGTLADDGKVETALANIKARMLVMPAQTDQYFTPEASEEEVKHLKHGKLAVIPTVWGHVAGGGGNDEDTQWMEEQVSAFLSNE